MSEKYTENDIGTTQEVIIEGVSFMDTIVGVFLPDGQYVIGPRLKCAHLFARFSMVTAMEQVSQEIQKMRGGE